MLAGLDPGDPGRGTGEDEHGSQRAKEQHAEVRTEPQPASWRWLGGRVAPVVGEAAWDVPDVGDGMERDHREPDQGTEVVKDEEWASLDRTRHQKADPAAGQHEGCSDKQRGQHPKRQVGWTFAHEGGRSGVVAHKAMAGAAELDNKRTRQEHSDVDMGRHQRVQDCHRHEFDNDQYEEQCPGQRGHPFVANYCGPGFNASRIFVRLPRWGHEAVNIQFS